MAQAAEAAAGLPQVVDTLGGRMHVRWDEVAAASHANQTTLYLTPLHGRADVLKRLIAPIGAALHHGRATAEQFKGRPCRTPATRMNTGFAG